MQGQYCLMFGRNGLQCNTAAKISITGRKMTSVFKGKYMYRILHFLSGFQDLQVPVFQG